MSARRAVIRLTPRAMRDAESILANSELTWGMKQSAAYQAAITKTLSLLRNHPRLGHPRDDLLPGCRSINVEQHVIYYQPQDREIVVLRILHGRQDPSDKVKEPRSRT